MKTIISRLLLLTATLFVACNNQEEEEVHMDGPVFSINYSINLGFDDKSGNDKLDGLNFDTKTGYVAETEYSYQSSLSNNPYLKLKVISEGDKKYLLFFEGVLSTSSLIPTVVTQVLRCRYIFGDDKQHTITSFWNKTRPFSFRCAKVLLDGNEIEIKYDESLGEPYVRAVL